MEALHVGGGRPRPSHSHVPNYSSSQAATLASSSSAAAAAQAQAQAQAGPLDGDGGPSLRGMDSNLGALCEHVQVDGWKSRAFSDIVVKAMGHTFHLHRLLLSRSSYFRNMLQGPWREAGAPEVNLQIDDENVNGDAVATALAYLYGHYPKLDDSNAFRVLAAGSFLDLQRAIVITRFYNKGGFAIDGQDLCALCTNFIISELWTENFLAYQAFAESQDYGVHGERVRKACWGYLCRGGAVELREILPKLSTQTLRTLLTSDELWVMSEEKRFELALSVLVARGVVLEIPQLTGSNPKSSPMTETPASENEGTSSPPPCEDDKVDQEIDEKSGTRSASDDEPGNPAAVEDSPEPETNEVAKTVHDMLFELVDSAVTNFSGGISPRTVPLSLDSRNSLRADQCAGGVSVCNYDHGLGSPCGDALKDVNVNPSPPFIEIRKNGEACTSGDTCSTPEQLGFPSGDSAFCSRYGYDEAWRPPRTGDHLGHGACSLSPETTSSSPSSKALQDQWSRDGACPTPSWGGRVVERRSKKAYPNSESFSEDWEAFLGVFEGGGVLYCHMTFDDLLYMRGRLEELGFPCKSVADSLWLQTLLRQQVLTIAADTCRNCSLVYQNCNCRQFNPSYAHGRIPGLHYREDGPNSGPGSFPGAEGIGGGGGGMGSGGGANNSQSTSRLHARNALDGLAGIGRGTTFGPPGSWPAPRFLYIPSLGAYGARGGPHQGGIGNGNNPMDLGGRDLPAHSGTDGHTPIVGLIQGGGANNPDLSVRAEESSSSIAKPANMETMLTSNNVLAKNSSADVGVRDWEGGEGASILLDLHTPLRSFPPFRFGVEFEDVHRLGDGQSKHSHEAFYAGSLWKVSVQAFNDEDPRGRRTLGLFLHRRKAEDVGPHRKVSFYTDTREKVTARYQLICPAKRGVIPLGSLTQAGTLLPKAPKGWGWRTAFLFDELADLLQGGSLRVAAVVQLV